MTDNQKETLETLEFFFFNKVLELQDIVHKRMEQAGIEVLVGTAVTTRGLLRAYVGSAITTIQTSIHLQGQARIDYQEACKRVRGALTVILEQEFPQELWDGGWEHGENLIKLNNEKWEKKQNESNKPN